MDQFEFLFMLETNYQVIQQYCSATRLHECMLEMRNVTLLKLRPIY